MQNSDFERVQHINDYCDDIAEAIKRFGDSCEAFSSDHIYRHAVSMCILQIGELAKGLTQEFQEKTRNVIPWNLVKGMRDYFAHGYGEMDIERIWEASTQDIPKLKAFCLATLSQQSI